MISSKEFVERSIALFQEYAEDFGLTNADFPDDLPEERQVDYEHKFRELVCEHKGHRIVPDTCKKPACEFCYVCNRKRTDIETPSNT